MLKDEFKTDDIIITEVKYGRKNARSIWKINRRKQRCINNGSKGNGNRTERKWKIDMYKVRMSIDGIIKEITINANDAYTAQQMATNMYSNGNVQIIDIRRV